MKWLKISEIKKPIPFDTKLIINVPGNDWYACELKERKETGEGIIHTFRQDNTDGDIVDATHYFVPDLPE